MHGIINLSPINQQIIYSEGPGLIMFLVRDSPMCVNHADFYTIKDHTAAKRKILQR